MCGISGIVDFQQPPQKKALRAMLRQINYRGPNSSGAFTAQHVALGINRLSVLDLKTGDQPIPNENGMIVVVYNGEIYNFKKLKAGLEAQGHKFKTKTDTEVLVHLYEEEGLDFVKKLSGMFAFALWDGKRSQLILGRDRIGIKPLYFHTSSTMCVFSSELKSLLASNLVPKLINKQAVETYMTLGYIPQSLSIIKNVHKLLPGTLLVFSKKSVKTHIYWNPRSFKPEKPNKEKLDRILKASITSQTIADVPWGVFLSGGLDSSLLVHYLASQQKHISTFSIKFTQKRYDESEFARLISKKYRTTHQEILYSSKTLLMEFNEIIDRLDEPLGDPSLFPTYHLSKMAKKKITVALTGDGGDELFGGYPTFQGEWLANVFSYCPRFLNKPFEGLVSLLPLSFGTYSTKQTLKLFFDSLTYPQITRQLEWASRLQNHVLLPTLDKNTWYHRLSTSLRELKISQSLKYQWLLVKTYLPDDLLVKTDRASILNSLEARVPFLDDRLVNYAFSSGNHVDPFRLKKQLKALGKDLLPPEIAGRKKKGFGIPISEWSKQDLKSLMQKNLMAKRLHQYIAKETVDDLWASHIRGTKDNARLLWSLTILSAWLASFDC